MSSRALRPLATNNNEYVCSKKDQKRKREGPRDKAKVECTCTDKENYYFCDSTDDSDEHKILKGEKQKQENIVDLLTSSEVKEGYWKNLAEERRRALEVTLKENESLHEQLEVLEAENAILKERSEESERLLNLIMTHVNEQDSTEAEK